MRGQTDKEKALEQQQEEREQASMFEIAVQIGPQLSRDPREVRQQLFDTYARAMPGAQLHPWVDRVMAEIGRRKAASGSTDWRIWNGELHLLADKYSEEEFQLAILPEAEYLEWQQRYAAYALGIITRNAGARAAMAAQAFRAPLEQVGKLRAEVADTAEKRLVWACEANRLPKSCNYAHQRPCVGQIDWEGEQRPCPLADSEACPQVYTPDRKAEPLGAQAQETVDYLKGLLSLPVPVAESAPTEVDPFA